MASEVEYLYTCKISRLTSGYAPSGLIIPGGPRINGSWVGKWLLAKSSL
jgi:hypothetical protein